MKDIKLKSKETTKLKPSLSKPGKPHVGSSPFQDGLIVDVERSKRRISNMLRAERKAFLEKLGTTKFLRAALENRAAIIIQKYYRGHRTRIHWKDISDEMMIQKALRSDIRHYLRQKNIDISLRRHRHDYCKIRSSAAVKIQCIFRKYLSRLCLQRKRREFVVYWRRQAAMTIQCFFRSSNARNRTKFRDNKKKFIERTRATIKIQCAYRRWFARRRVRRRRLKLQWLAVRMIQCWFRARNSRKMAKAIKDLLHKKLLNRGALRMQCLVRHFLSRRRTNRIRLRKLFQFVFKNTTRIQCMIRRFLCNIRVKRLRDVHRIEVARRIEADTLKQKQLENEKLNVEKQEFLKSLDIFQQVRDGKLSEVEVIYMDLSSRADFHVSSVIEHSTGNSLMHFASEFGHLEIVRKCVLWGVDVNQRNHDGQTALMLAVRNQHIHVVQYIMSSNTGNTSAVSPRGSGHLHDHNNNSNSNNSSNNGIKETVMLSKLSVAISEEDSFAMLSSAIGSSRPLSSNGSTISHSSGKSITMLTALIHFGLNVNSCESSSGLTPLLVACEHGNMEAVKVLLKSKANKEAIDKSGQDVFHKASMSSAEIVRGLVGVDMSLGISIPEATRASYLLRRDSLGKDCALLAAIYGQRAVLEVIQEVVQKTPLTHLPERYRVQKAVAPASVIYTPTDVDISWTTNDFNSILTLAESNDVFCFSRVLQAGVNVDWTHPETGMTMAMAACKRASMDVIDTLLLAEADFSVVDINRWNVFHFAAVSRNSTVCKHLLSHQCSKACFLHSLMLADQEELNQDTPVHILLREGIMDLSDEYQEVARAGLQASMSLCNRDGLTPLHLACSLINHDAISACLSMEANPSQLDSHGRGALWHMFHPNHRAIQNITGVVHTTTRRLRVPACSELPARKTFLNMTRRERDEDNTRLAKDMDVVLHLLGKGCPLFLPTSLPGSLESMSSLPHVFQGNNKIFTPDYSVDDALDCVDIAARELSIALFKALPSFLTPAECWRVVLSAIRFDDGSNKALFALFEGGAIDLLSRLESHRRNKMIRINSGESSQDSQSTFNNHGNTADSGSTRPQTPGGTLRENDITQLQSAYFAGFNLAGWVIRFGNVTALQQLVRRGYNPQLYADKQGNTCLHLIAMQRGTWTGSMFDVIGHDSRVRLEAENFQGMSASMICAKTGNIQLFKKLFSKGVDAHRGLLGGYYAWLLAFAKRKDRNEQRTQTGRIGLDDERYYPMPADYLIWV